MNDPITPVTDKVGGLMQGFFYILPNLGIALLVFLVFMVVAWGVRRGIASLLGMRDRTDLGVLLGGFAKWAVLLFGVLVVAAIVFPSVKPADLLSALGVGSVAIGFAFKDILQNWMSGLLILYRQPFRRGDQIKSGEFEGTVEAIEARATVLRTYDGQRVVIPNSDIYTRTVTVRTAYTTRRSEYDVGIGYGDDVAQACEVIRRAIADLDGAESDPAPEAIPWELAGSSVNIRARWWSNSQRVSVVHTRGRVIAAIKRELSQAGIDLPFPTRVVLLHDQTEATDGDRARQREGWPAGGEAPEPRHLNELIVHAAPDAKGAKGSSKAQARSASSAEQPVA